MASDVDICNLALGHLGDRATIASIDPPEGSAQAEHCARFYPIARDSLLEMHTWGFATRRVVLAELGSGWPEWQHSYAQPSDALNILAVLPPDADDDYSTQATVWGLNSGVPTSAGGRYVPQPFSCEIDPIGEPVIYTDQEQAVLRYTARVTDPTQFSPTFVMTLSWHLAGLLAGPILKGDVGAAEAKRCAAATELWLMKARESDANQRRVNPQHNVSWMAGR